ncbi:carbonic anhydrase [Salinibacillus aidingensis]|uniref:carbonic anhydrase n=1 Tax=Salinibacillus aidingensis TaxID=237684 RepID=A0ABP3KZX9_9BACI
MLLDEILEFNNRFVQDKQYEPYETDGLPDKKVVILSCMDTRLVELLPQALNIKNGDVKLVKNAGAMVSSPTDGAVKSILVGIHALNADEVMVIGHHDCGMGKVNPDDLVKKLETRGISREQIEAFENNQNTDAKEFLKGFTNVEDNVKNSVDILNNHPLIPETIPVHGLVIDPHTGKLDLVVNGY